MIRPRFGQRAIATVQAVVLLLALAALSHHRAVGPHAAWVAPSAVSAAAMAAPVGADRAHADPHACSLCRAAHARYVPDAIAANVVRTREARVARIPPAPAGAAPAPAVDLLTAPKTSPPV